MPNVNVKLIWITVFRWLKGNDPFLFNRLCIFSDYWNFLTLVLRNNGTGFVSKPLRGCFYANMMFTNFTVISLNVKWRCDASFHLYIKKYNSLAYIPNAVGERQSVKNSGRLNKHLWFSCGNMCSPLSAMLCLKVIEALVVHR